MPDLATALRAAAVRIEEVNDIKAWVDGMPAGSAYDFHLALSWHSGSACRGYKPLAARVSVIVARQMDSLIAQALTEAESEAAAAQDEVAALMGIDHA